MNAKQNNLQAGLGREFEVYKEAADMLSMATVIKVNFLYNTVDVMIIDSKSTMISGEEKSGQFSARLPVNFGGSFSNGDTYGQTIPVNVGDQVLLGFLNSKSNAPIVLGIYKNDAGAYKLAPTNQITGDPEELPLRQSAMENLTVFPAQVYEWVDGLGNMEKTFNGLSFLKVASGLSGSAKPNDYGFEYDNLQRYHLRGKDIHPTNSVLPIILFQHAADFAKTRTNVLFDEDESFSISKTERNTTDTNRSELRINSTNDIQLRTQHDDDKYDIGSQDFEAVGILDSVPYMSASGNVVTLTERGLLINGEPVGTSESGGNIDEIERRVDKLGNDINLLTVTVQKIDDIEIPGLNSRLTALDTSHRLLRSDFDKTKAIVDSLNYDFEPLKNDVANNSEALRNLNLTISNSAGTYPSLPARLDAIESEATVAKQITDEIINSRTYKDDKGNIIKQYDSLPTRLNDMSKQLDAISKDVGDFSKLREDVDELHSTLGDVNGVIDSMKNSLNILTDMAYDNEDTTYEVIITPDNTTTFRNGYGSVNLNATVLRNGMDISALIDLDSSITWTRKSMDDSGDTAWNNAHTNPVRFIEVNAADVNTSAKYTASYIGTNTGSKYLSGSITVSNVTDVDNAELSISSDKLPRQKYNADTGTFTPDFTVTPVELYGVVVDAANNIVDNKDLTEIKWYVEESGSYSQILDNDPNFVINKTDRTKLTVKRNINPELGRFYVWLSLRYDDDKNDTHSNLRSDFTFEISDSSARPVFLDLFSKNGFLFMDTQPSSIVLHADMYSNNTIDTANDTAYKWFIKDDSVLTPSNPKFDISAGVGWAAIRKNTITGLTPSGEFNAKDKTGSSELTVQPTAFTGAKEFQLVAISQTNVLRKFVSLSNFNSGYNTRVTSTNGLILREGTTETTLEALVYNAQGEFDRNGNLLKYTWKIVDSTGKNVPALTGVAGKKITVHTSDIPTETFTANVTVETR